MMFFHCLIGVVDVSVAGQIGDHVQAALGMITQTLLFFLIIAIALATLAAGIRVESILFLPAFAFNMTAFILVGHAVGYDNPEEAKRIGARTWILGGVFLGSRATRYTMLAIGGTVWCVRLPLLFVLGHIVLGQTTGI